MKKVLKLLIIAVLLLSVVSGLVACGGKSAETGEQGVICRKFSGDNFYTVVGYGAEEMSCEAEGGAPVLVEAQDLMRAEHADPVGLAEAVAKSKQVVTCCEVGSGIVPIEREERAWRERVGAFSKELAKRADVVVRVTAGIPQALAGTLPDQHDFQLVIMRHGTTPYNEQRRYTGTTDIGLSEEGERQGQQFQCFHG